MNSIVSQRQLGESNLQFFRRILGDVVVDVAMHGQNEAYIAMKQSEMKIQIYVAAIRMIKCHMDCERSFRCEEIEFICFSETTNPAPANCPRRILDQVSPVDTLFERGTHPWRAATLWRLRAKTNLEKREEKRHIKRKNIPIPA